MAHWSCSGAKSYEAGSCDRPDWPRLEQLRRLSAVTDNQQVTPTDLQLLLLILLLLVMLLVLLVLLAELDALLHQSQLLDHLLYPLRLQLAVQQQGQHVRRGPTADLRHTVPTADTQTTCGLTKY